jgi:hypothetical protein
MGGSMKKTLIMSLAVNAVLFGALACIFVLLPPLPKPTPPAVRYVFVVTNVTSVAESPGR